MSSRTSIPAFPPYSERLRRQQLDEVRDVDKGHGRIEIRHLQSSSRLGGFLDWPGFAQAIRIERTRITGDERVTEVSHAITSLGPDRANAKHLLDLNRGHWGIENRLHWVRDVTMGEDKCRARTGHGPVNLACLRNASLTFLRDAGHSGIATALRTFATKPTDLLKLLSRFKK
ncbi:ISAs1 family transposase [Planctomycetes bacterium CA13]|uniref:ISAs1 family transposase n=1 Tax=Novipirellula herctigrandis TaxID=2527986 RepID=UPI0011B3AB53